MVVEKTNKEERSYDDFICGRSLECRIVISDFKGLFNDWSSRRVGVCSRGVRIPLCLGRLLRCATHLNGRKPVLPHLDCSFQASRAHREGREPGESRPGGAKKGGDGTRGCVVGGPRARPRGGGVTEVSPRSPVRGVSPFPRQRGAEGCWGARSGGTRSFFLPQAERAQVCVDIGLLGGVS